MLLGKVRRFPIRGQIREAHEISPGHRAVVLGARKAMRAPRCAHFQSSAAPGASAVRSW